MPLAQRIVPQATRAEAMALPSQPWPPTIPLYNEPNIRHAMASDDAPLFALWSLWTGRAP